MVGLVIVHLEFTSAYSLFGWNRIGLVSTAEGFVFLSGFVVGMVYHVYALKNGAWSATQKLWLRAWQLYKINVFVILSIAVLYLIPGLDTHAIMTWTSVSGGPTIWLYPAPSDHWLVWLKRALLLEIGPHQFQVIGLYVILMLIAPFALWLCLQKKTGWLMGFSLAAYVFYQFHPMRLSSMRFEYGFPILAWQVIFLFGLMLGTQRAVISAFFTAQRRQYLLIVCVLISVAFFLLALNSPSRVFWPEFIPTIALHWISPENFGSLYQFYFDKTSLGLGRLINNASLFIVAYLLLSRYWVIFNRLLGWLFIPIGQASLTVFFLHVYVILLIMNTGLLDKENFFLNTAIHTAALAVLWCFAKVSPHTRWLPR